MTLTAGWRALGGVLAAVGLGVGGLALAGAGRIEQGADRCGWGTQGVVTRYHFIAPAMPQAGHAVTLVTVAHRPAALLVWDEEGALQRADFFVVYLRLDDEALAEAFLARLAARAAAEGGGS